MQLPYLLAILVVLLGGVASLLSQAAPPDRIYEFESSNGVVTQCTSRIQHQCGSTYTGCDDGQNYRCVVSKSERTVYLSEAAPTP